ncbi:MAG: flagellar export protein FliJ [Candidatus Gastranaerophilales bacterium]|nr:flagellar export protein FliJ [Candidatus Gastranaerophilales bacterium]
MKNFKFRMQSVLEAREKIQENKELELAKILNILKEQQNYLKSLENSRQNTVMSLEKILDKGSKINFMHIKNHQDYIEKLKGDILNQQQTIANTQIEVNAKKQDLIEAMKDKTIIEKLKEKDYKAFLKEQERLDFIQIDEIATGKYAKKQTSSWGNRGK